MAYFNDGTIFPLISKDCFIVCIEECGGLPFFVGVFEWDPLYCNHLAPSCNQLIYNKLTHQLYGFTANHIMVC